MNESEYLRLKAKLDTDYQSKLRSLNDVWAMSNEGTPTPKSVNGHMDALVAVRGYWRQLAHQIVLEMPSGNQFTVKELQTAITDRNPAITTDPIGVSIYMKKLLADREIRIAQQGAGRRGTVYAKK